MTDVAKRLRVWWADEFRECKTDEERDDLAWEVPPERGILNHEVLYYCEDVDDAAQKYAEYFFHERDGHENTWPLDFVVHDGVNYHRVSVELDYEPTFSAAEPEIFTP